MGASADHEPAPKRRRGSLEVEELKETDGSGGDSSDDDILNIEKKAKKIRIPDMIPGKLFLSEKIE